MKVSAHIQMLAGMQAKIVITKRHCILTATGKSNRHVAEIELGTRKCPSFADRTIRQVNVHAFIVAVECVVRVKFVSQFDENLYYPGREIE
jgi:hypothetical protein